MKNIADSG